MTGSTWSADFPTVNPLQGVKAGGTDAFVSKLDATGSALVYSTYLGGSGLDQGSGIAVDSAGNAYVTGATYSTDFPTANPLQATNGGGGWGDAFVAKFNAAGSALVYSTYLGGSGGDSAAGIALDGAGNAYVTGATSSTDFPTASPLQNANGSSSAYYSVDDAFVAKIAGTPLCGDGVVDLDEECDLGVANGSPDFCCSWCRLQGSTHVCRPASGDCDAPENCSGSIAGECAADRKHFDGTPCDGCSGQCSAGVCISGGTPLSNCRTAEKSVLQSRRNPWPGKLLWKWIRGESTSLAELGDPQSTGTYTLCLYAGTANAVLGSVVVPPSAARWSRIRDKGYQYAYDPADRWKVTIRLKGSDRNRARALVKQNWSPSLPYSVFSLPVTVQLFNSETGLCLGATYDSGDVIKNEPDQFKAKTQD